MPPLPAPITIPDHALALDRRAERRTTPCGEGELVWHPWGDGAPLRLHGGAGSGTHGVRNIGARAARCRCAPGTAWTKLPPAPRTATTCVC